MCTVQYNMRRQMEMHKLTYVQVLDQIERADAVQKTTYASRVCY